MQVAHSGNFECALCGFTGKDIIDLENHLPTCDTYSCKYCFSTEETFYSVSDVKTNLTNKHPKHIKNTEIEHIKMNQKTVNKYLKKYSEVHIPWKLFLQQLNSNWALAKKKHLCLSGDPCDSHL